MATPRTLAGLPRRWRWRTQVKGQALKLTLQRRRLGLWRDADHVTILTTHSHLVPPAARIMITRTVPKETP